MTEDNKQSEDLSALSADINYFQSMVDLEKDTIRQNIAEAIAESKDPYSHLDIVTEAFTDIIALISARVKVLETVLAAKDTIEKRVVESGRRVDPENNLGLIEELTVTAEQFAHEENMYGLEKADSGVSYTWTGPDPTLRLSLPVTRDKEKQFSLSLVGVVDDALLETVEVLINGSVAEISYSMKNGLNSLDVNLCESDQSELTIVEINLERTFSPLELGKGDDKRRLGLAVADYSVRHLPSSEED